jgi:hypothetical protein
MWTGETQHNGKCWTSQGPQGLGYWHDCATPAATTAPAPQRPAKNTQKQHL